MLQVELNTIASSFGCLSTQVCKMHRYIVERAGQPDLKLSNLPANDVTSQIADAIGSAVHTFECEGAAVLFVVQPDEKNSYDQQVFPAYYVPAVLGIMHVNTLYCMGYYNYHIPLPENTQY